MPDRIRPRGDTAANWTSANPVLQEREIGLETDTRRYKIGDGTTAWNSLSYNQIGDRYYTTSTTSESVTNGAKTFTVSAGLAYTPQQAIQIVSTASPANHMHGTVTSYSGTTLVVNVDKSTGSGTFSSWTINVGGVSGATVPLSPDPTGVYGSTAQLASLTVNSLGQVTAASTSTFTLPNIQAFAASGTWTKPPNAKRVKIELIGGGGGGGSGSVGYGSVISAGGGGGGSGGHAIIELPADQVTSTVSVTIGTGGNGATAIANVLSNNNGLAGTAGGTTSFGTYVYAGGGGGGGGGVTAGLGTPAGSAGAGASGGNTGGAASATGAAGSAGVPGSANATSTIASGGGGAGGGVTSANVGSSGGAGGRINILNTAGGTAGAGGAGVGGSGSNTVAAGPFGGIVRGSGGGGGGGFFAVAAFSSAGVGGVGGQGGGGGGGGGAIGAGSSMYLSSGAGGAGGSGYALITTYFY